MAAGLWLGNAGAVSHRAAALRWRLDGISTAPVELTTIGQHRCSDPGLVLHRVVAFDADAVVVRGGIRITSVPRTLIDLCAVSAPEIVEKALECALRLGLSDVERIHSALANGGRRPRGARILGELLGDFPGKPTESVLETLVWALLRDGGLPRPERQYRVRDAAGVVVARVDFAYPDELIAIEADGHAFHSTRRDWYRDRERQNALVRLGWKVYRITWDDTTRRGQQVVSDIAALLSQVTVPTRS
jgi:very-short-patch-repair endonuclease